MNDFLFGAIGALIGGVAGAMLARSNTSRLSHPLRGMIAGALIGAIAAMAVATVEWQTSDGPPPDCTTPT